MKLTPWIALGVIAAAAPTTQAQGIGKWTAHTSLLRVQSARVDADGTLWAATTGGVFNKSPEGDITIYRNVDELLSLSAQAIAEDASGGLYFGMSDGILEYRKGSSWQHITDIKQRADVFPDVGIRSMLAVDKYIFIGTGFGMVVYDPQTGLFPSTITNIGSLTSVAVNDIMVQGSTLWVATSNGVAKAEITPQFLANPRIPDYWTVFRAPANASQQNFVALSTTPQQEVVAAFDRAIYRMANDSLRLLTSLEIEVIDLINADGELHILTPFYLANADQTKTWTPGNSDRLVSVNTANSPTQLLVGTQLSGLYIVPTSYNTTTTERIVPNCPISNIAGKISVSPSGLVIVTTGIDDRGQGASALLDGTWYPLIPEADSTFTSKGIYRTSPLTASTSWLGSWGGGGYELEVRGSQLQARRYDEKNSPLLGISSSPSFVLAGEAAFDTQGLLWILNPATNGLLYRSTDGVLRRIANGFSGTLDHTVIACDAFGTKWLGSRNETGLIAFNDRFSPANTGDDIWRRYLTSSSAIPSNAQNALVLDADQQLWIATPRGLSVAVNPGSALNSDNRVVFRSINALNGINTNDLAIDAVNTKWVATSNGLWNLSEDGSQVLGNWTTANSPLPSNSVLGVAVDKDQGIVYVGTEAGLYSLSIAARTPRPDFSQISCYPQPFRPDSDNSVVIDGLGPNATVIISTIDGVRVRSIEAQGSRTVTWDGTDEAGQRIPSGVYVVAAASSSGSASGAAKLMVLRSQ